MWGLRVAISLQQVAQVFELEGPSSGLLQPASKREMLAALLAVLRDASWARAVGCPAEPGFMIPISCATALQRTSTLSEVSSRQTMCPCSCRQGSILSITSRNTLAAADPLRQ